MPSPSRCVRRPSLDHETPPPPPPLWILSRIHTRHPSHSLLIELLSCPAPVVPGSPVEAVLTVETDLIRSLPREDTLSSAGPLECLSASLSTRQSTCRCMVLVLSLLFSAQLPPLIARVFLRPVLPAPPDRGCPACSHACTALRTPQHRYASHLSASDCSLADGPTPAAVCCSPGLQMALRRLIPYPASKRYSAVTMVPRASVLSILLSPITCLSGLIEQGLAGSGASGMVVVGAAAAVVSLAGLIVFARRHR